MIKVIWKDEGSKAAFLVYKMRRWGDVHPMDIVFAQSSSLEIEHKKNSLTGEDLTYIKIPEGITDAVPSSVAVDWFEEIK